MLQTNFTPFPVLITERLVLRPIEMNDDKDIFAHRSDDNVNTYLDSFRHSGIEETRTFIERIQREVAANKTILWVLTEKGKNKFIGTVCLWNISRKEQKAETGYTLHPEFQKKGYMNEALAKVICFGFNTVKLRTIEAYTHQDNSGSIRLLEKNKFKLDSSLKATEEKGKNRIIFTLRSSL